VVQHIWDDGGVSRLQNDVLNEREVEKVVEEDGFQVRVGRHAVVGQDQGVHLECNERLGFEERRRCEEKATLSYSVQ
jgi:hypothetical protein